MNPAMLFTAATTCYAANCALGVGVATRLVDTTRVHWLHHALYATTATMAGAAASSLLWSENTAGWALLPAAVPMALIPYVSTKSRRHMFLALSAAPFFAASAIKAWR